MFIYYNPITAPIKMEDRIEQIAKDKIANTAALEKYGSLAIRRRLTRELESLYSVFLKIEIQLNELSNPKITIYENVGAYIHRYDFIISENYPFVKPEVFFQNQPYRKFLQTMHSDVGRKMFKTVTGFECLCCHSVTCNSNWSPGLTLHKIIEEIHHYRRLKRNVLNKVFADIIKRKYLIGDIDLDSWLF